MHTVLNALARSFAPLIPFVTDIIYRGIYNKSVHLEIFPRPEKISEEKKLIELTTLLLDVNSAIW
ncbi:unnamed protein product, partial [marine sediment metagenome]